MFVNQNTRHLHLRFWTRGSLWVVFAGGMYQKPIVRGQSTWYDPKDPSISTGSNLIATGPGLARLARGGSQRMESTSF